MCEFSQVVLMDGLWYMMLEGALLTDKKEQDTPFHVTELIIIFLSLRNGMDVDPSSLCVVRCRIQDGIV